MSAWRVYCTGLLMGIQRPRQGPLSFLWKYVFPLFCSKDLYFQLCICPEENNFCGTKARSWLLKDAIWMIHLAAVASDSEGFFCHGTNEWPWYATWVAGLITHVQQCGLCQPYLVLSLSQIGGDPSCILDIIKQIVLLGGVYGLSSFLWFFSFVHSSV